MLGKSQFAKLPLPAKLSRYTVLYSCFTGPSALTVITARNAVNLSVVLQWEAIDDSLPTYYTVTWIYWYYYMQSYTLIEQSSYTITGLTLDRVYTIIVTASNNCGTGPEYRTSVLFPTGTYVQLSTVNLVYTMYVMISKQIKS